MHVAIDIRRADDFGIGTYIRNIVNQLARLNGTTRYLLIGRREHWEELNPLPGNFELFQYEADPGSLRAHFHLPLVLQRRQVDLLHVPWFYAPAVVPCHLVM